eukprot:TRINITY_DN620_c0_g4_i1.p1 TRINITY_DN620_c0_g4~~TRINITY_DN620_c0_g4_i1.p1  ORF type:complete len:484 (-),score=141.89 TRINITY_DN620_c0_g4_i1:111-1562(-)
MAGDTAIGSQYSTPVGYVYIFNLIVGVGALSLPLGFKEAGIIAGLLMLVIIATCSFITVTWTVEALSIANATKKLKNIFNTDIETSQLLQVNAPERNSTNTDVSDIQSDSKEAFQITERIELGEIANITMGPIWEKIFYGVLIIYLYGDLAIYAVTVASSISSVSILFGETPSDHQNTYRFYVSMFFVAVLPFCFFDFQKTKYLQIATLATRNIALFMMIILAFMQIFSQDSESRTKISDIKVFDVKEVASLFGVSIYAFMCHHSLPAIVSAIANKNYIVKMFCADFFTVFSVYLLLTYTAMFAFGKLVDVGCETSYPCSIISPYNLNFQKYDNPFVSYFLALFPVFTLTTNFPLIAITLRNNLLQLFSSKEKSTSISKLRVISFTLLTVIPPVVVALITSEVKLLVDITGSYAGLLIMLVMPALFVFYGRRNIKNNLSKINQEYNNLHASPFQHSYFVFFILFASAVSLVLVTVNNVIKLVD